jgi:hypothetical protein
LLEYPAPATLLSSGIGPPHLPKPIDRFGPVRQMRDRTPRSDEIQKTGRDPSVEHCHDHTALHAPTHAFAQSGIAEAKAMTLGQPRRESRKRWIEIQH